MSRNFGLLLSLWSLLAWAGPPAPQAVQPNGKTPDACARCHVEALTQPTTYMSHALETVEKSKILNEHPALTTTVGKYSYRIQRQGNESDYTVTDGVSTVTLPIRWAMGASKALGQTYILEKDGQIYESRVSWFRELNGLGETMGYEGTLPVDINDAAGRLIHQDEKLRCFGCHATNAVQGRHLMLETMTPGVQCEHCHEGTQQHLTALQLGRPAPKELSKLIKMSAEQASEFCGQCHRTWADVALQANPGISNIRFQPYRLTGSKCYDPEDARIGCLACHNPHHDFEDAQKINFDPKCLNCHAGGKPGAKACPVSKEKCISCHMPKLELPGAHYKFTDHRIRIVKPGEPYPG